MKKRTLSLLCLSAAGAAISLSSTVPAGADATGALVCPLPSNSASSGLLEVSPGLFYGCQGANDQSNGAIYSVTSGGAYSQFAVFKPGQGYPNSELIKGKNDDFYSTTVNFGASTGNSVFSMTPAGAIKILYDMSSNTDLGIYPQGVIQASDGSLYGTTNPPTIDDGGYGTFYKVTTSGRYTLLHTFSPSVDGYTPTAVVQASDGMFYGGSENPNSGEPGVIFSFTSTGAETIIKSNMYVPVGFTLNSDGTNMYGVSGVGTDADPTFFRLHAPSSFAVLSNAPYLGTSQMVLGPDGNYYGTTPAYLGPNDTEASLIFRLTPAGVEQNLYVPSAAAADSGKRTIVGKLCFGSDGKLYATCPSSVFTVDLSSGPVDPVLNSISPSTVIAGGPAFTMTLHGTGFQSSTQVVLVVHKHGTYFLNPTSVTPTVLQVSVPAAAITQVRQAVVYTQDTTTTDESAQKVLHIEKAS